MAEHFLVVVAEVQSASGDWLVDFVIPLCMTLLVDRLGPCMPVEAWLVVAVRSIHLVVLK